MTCSVRNICQSLWKATTRRRNLHHSAGRAQSFAHSGQARYAAASRFIFSKGETL